MGMRMGCVRILGAGARCVAWGSSIVMGARVVRGVGVRGVVGGSMGVGVFVMGGLVGGRGGVVGRRSRRRSEEGVRSSSLYSFTSSIHTFTMLPLPSLQYPLVPPLEVLSGATLALLCLSLFMADALYTQQLEP
jgi:hypothetical protein